MTEEEKLIEFNKKLLELSENYGFLIQEISELPEKIKSFENKLICYVLKKNEIESSMNSWDNNMLLLITSEQVDGKQKYTNEMQRKAVLNQRQTESKEYSELRNQLNKKIEEENIDKVEFNYLDRRFKALRTVAELLSGGRK